MATFNLTFAGIPFVSDKGVSFIPPERFRNDQDREYHFTDKHRSVKDMIDELNKAIPFDQINDLRLHGESCGVKIGEWHYPNGACRFSVFRGLATSDIAKDMLASTSGASASFNIKNVPVPIPEDKVDAHYEITTSLFMLPPRPIAELGLVGMDYCEGLYLITLVDDRYYWQQKPATLTVGESTTWANLITDLQSVIGSTISYSAIDSAYGRPDPDSSLWAIQQPVSVLLDSVATNIGRVVVRNMDGTISLLTPAESIARIASARGTINKLVRYAGGEIFASGGSIAAGNLNASKNPIVPSSYQFSFQPFVVADPVPHLLNTRYQNPSRTAWHEDLPGGSYEVSVPITSGGSYVSGIAGQSTQVIHSTAKAYINAENSSVANNHSGLVSLSMQLASDQYGWQAGIGLDEVYQGIYAWTPDGHHDIIWTFSTRKGICSTRVMRTEWNRYLQCFQHNIPNSNGSYQPPGVGGKTVAQTVRHSYTDSVAQSLGQNLASGDSTVFLGSQQGLPTNERWKVSVGSETILLEGTSGKGTTSGVGIVRRGVDGTSTQSHLAGSTMQWNRSAGNYGVNLVTHGPGQFVMPGVLASGGIQEAKVIPQTQTVHVLSATPTSVNGVNHYPAQVLLHNAKDSTTSGLGSCWVVERNGTNLTAGNKYDGLFIGWGGGGSPNPVYAVNESTGGGGGGSLSSGGTTTINNYTYTFTSGVNIYNGDYLAINISLVEFNNTTINFNSTTIVNYFGYVEFCGTLAWCYHTYAAQTTNMINFQLQDKVVHKIPMNANIDLATILPPALVSGKPGIYVIENTGTNRALIRNASTSGDSYGTITAPEDNIPIPPKGLAFFRYDDTDSASKLISVTPHTMGAATAGTAGYKGLVPTPAAGDNDRFLRGDGTWQPGASLSYTTKPLQVLYGGQGTASGALAQSSGLQFDDGNLEFTVNDLSATDKSQITPLGVAVYGHSYDSEILMTVNDIDNHPRLILDHNGVFISESIIGQIQMKTSLSGVLDSVHGQIDTLYEGNGGNQYGRLSFKTAQGSDPAEVMGLSQSGFIECVNLTASGLVHTGAVKELRVFSPTSTTLPADSTGGTSGGDLSDVGASFDQTTLNNNIASLYGMIDALRQNQIKAGIAT